MLNWLFVDWAVSFDKIIFGEICLAGDAVQPAVFVEFNISVVIARLQEFLYADAVTLFGRANEVVIADVELLPCISEKWCDRIGESKRLHASSIGSLLNFQAVLIGAS